MSEPIKTGISYKEKFGCEPPEGKPSEWTIYPNGFYNREKTPVKFKDLKSLSVKERYLKSKNVNFKKEKTILSLGDTSDLDRIKWDSKIFEGGEVVLSESKKSKNPPFVYYTWEYQNGYLVIYKILGTNSF